MIHNLALESVAANPAFEQVVAATQWEVPETPARLRVANALGWLVGVDENGDPESLVGFSVERVDRDETNPLLPPFNMSEVRARLEHPVKVGLFNTNMAAKGIGSVMANTPRALQPGSIHKDGIAVREVAFRSDGDMHTRKERDTPLSQKLRIVRHGVLLIASALVDKVTQKTTGTAGAAGTTGAVRYMERGYGQARLVEMPAPPIWQKQQRDRGITHEVPPRIVLVRGGKFALLNPMRRAGSYPAAKL